jgi:Family of unknown function (DUF6081)
LPATGPMASHIVAYDDFAGDQLDPGRWHDLTIHGLSGSEARIRFEPAAETRVGEGTLDLFVPSFGSKVGTMRGSDTINHERVSRRAFSTRDGLVVFTWDMAATRIGAAPADPRDGFASLMLVDIESGWSFQVCANGDKTFGLHDALRHGDRSPTPTEMIDPSTPVPAIMGRSRRHEVIINTATATIEWWTDKRLTFRVRDTDIPPAVRIALGLATLTSGHSTPEELSRPTSGLSVSFGPVTVRTEAFPLGGAGSH